MGVLRFLYIVLKDGGREECPECGQYTLPQEDKCPDCVEV